MNDIEIRKSENYWLISSYNIGISDFGETFEEAKENFKDAVGSIIQNKFEEMGEWVIKSKR